MQIIHLFAITRFCYAQYHFLLQHQVAYGGISFQPEIA